ncbi:MAG: hypothetical protein KKH67_07325 [candidate division Zixibacteria bacterium]|nr:hypothetical protein [candidate division Zixibacteria bacterium]MBU1470043.1 hypothetical protein [candidate division Zixibacteria bacterium]
MKNTSRGVALYVMIGPGPENVRKMLYDRANDAASVFNQCGRKLGTKWFTLHTKQLVKASDYQSDDGTRMRDILKEGLDKFKKSDLPAIIQEIEKLKGKF